MNKNAVVLVLVSTAISPCDRGFAQSAGEILSETGIQSGLVVHLGCGDGKLTAALCANDGYLVQGLDTDPKNVEQARKNIRELGVYGKVTATRYDGAHLPYIDNAVNLLVAEDPGKVSMSEAMRVLVPQGVAYLREDGEWTKTIKPWPEDMDEWTHYLHAPDRNPVALDRAAGPPRRLQWQDGPMRDQTHNTGHGMTGMVSARGRLFYIANEGPLSIIDRTARTDKWNLIARDAFNGLVLWRRPIHDWGNRAWSPQNSRAAGCWNGEPRHIHMRLVAVGDRVYVTPGFHAPVVALDAATGREIKTYPGTEYADEILCHEGMLIVAVDTGARRTALGKAGPAIEKSVLALDVASGKELWRTDGFHGVFDLKRRAGCPHPITRLMLAAGGTRLFMIEQDAIVSLDRNSGKELWRVPRPEKVVLEGYPHHARKVEAGALLYHDGVVLSSQPHQPPRNSHDKCQARMDLLALAAEDGRTLWRRVCGGWGYQSFVSTYVARGLVWTYGAPVYPEDPDSRKVVQNNNLLGLDLKTGKVKKHIDATWAFPTIHHHRCYRNRATQRYLIVGRNGTSYLDLDSGKVHMHKWIRGMCQFGVLPCNGLLYVPPKPCRCYEMGLIHGYSALAPEGDGGQRKPIPDENRLATGPAYGTLEEVSYAATDWPTYRHDARRSGAASTSIPKRLTTRWTVSVGGRPTSPVIAAGKVFIAAQATHEVLALDADTGKGLWRFSAGGPVDTPPTFHNGFVLFGCRNGSCYCLRASDGQLAWRFQGAPQDRRIIAFGQVESAWPAHGSVLVHEGVAYFSAGRSSFLDGGILVYALQPATGKVLARQIICADHEGRKAGWSPEGVLQDILVTNGRSVYLRNARMDPRTLSPTLLDWQQPSREYIYQDVDDPAEPAYLGATAGLLEGSHYGRTYWALGVEARGQMLVFDETCVYGMEFTNTGGHLSNLEPGTTPYSVFCIERKEKPGPLKLNGRAPFNPALGKRWFLRVSIRVEAMLLAKDTLFVAGPPDVMDPDDPLAAFEGRKGGCLWSISAADGTKLAEQNLAAPPVWDGMAVANGRVYVSLENGTVVCLGACEDEDGAQSGNR